MVCFVPCQSRAPDVGVPEFPKRGRGGGKIYQVSPEHPYGYGSRKTPTVDVRTQTDAHTGL